MVLSFAKGQQAFESIQSVYSQDNPKRKITFADMELRNYPKPIAFTFVTTKQKQLFS